MPDANKRLKNEKDFENWEDLETGGRLYWFEVVGRSGGKARYIKIVDENELTISFIQEIYNSEGVLIEIHEKYPIDKGHQKVNKNDN